MPVSHIHKINVLHLTTTLEPYDATANSNEGNPATATCLSATAGNMSDFAHGLTNEMGQPVTPKYWWIAQPSAESDGTSTTAHAVASASVTQTVGTGSVLTLTGTYTSLIDRYYTVKVLAVAAGVPSSVRVTTKYTTRSGVNGLAHDDGVGGSVVHYESIPADAATYAISGTTGKLIDHGLTLHFDATTGNVVGDTYTFKIEQTDGIANSDIGQVRVVKVGPYAVTLRSPTASARCHVFVAY